MAGKYWEQPNRIEGGDRERLKKRVTYVPEGTGWDEATLHVTGYWDSGDDGLLPFKRQPNITAEDVAKCPTILTPILMFLSDPAVKKYIVADPTLTVLAQQLVDPAAP